jgi:hypothetical protein
MEPAQSVPGLNLFHTPHMRARAHAHTHTHTHTHTHFALARMRQAAYGVL